MGDQEFDAPFDPDEPDDSEGGEGGEHPPRPAVFVTTTQPIAIRVERIEDERAPEASALGAYIDDRLVARSAMPPEAIERLLALGLFTEPVPLGLFAYEEEPGLQCRLFALVPRGAISASDHEDEPWKASVPRYEDALQQNGSDDDDDDDEEGDGAELETILLGHIVRFERDRKHPSDLAAEAVDILQRVLTGVPLEEADRKAIDDLLGSL
jgi:hypothetical protein